jgi:hypothetical protein
MNFKLYRVRGERDGLIYTANIVICYYVAEGELLDSQAWYLIGTMALRIWRFRLTEISAGCGDPDDSVVYADKPIIFIYWFDRGGSAPLRFALREPKGIWALGTAVEYPNARIKAVN